jgi:carboxylesterase
MQYIVPDSEPFFLPGGTTGCLLLHGFTAMPGEMRQFGEHLAEKGFTVLGVRLAGLPCIPMTSSERAG